MLRTLRESAVENPWFYRLIMLIIAVAFVITMGWGFGTSRAGKKDYVAKINGESITVDDFQSSYKTTVAFYRKMMGDKFSEEQLQKMHLKENTVKSLVDKKLWLQAAREMGISVSDDELHHLIVENEYFQKNKVFDLATYRSVLDYNKIAVSAYEESQREELLYEKVRFAVKDAAFLTADEAPVSGTAGENERVFNEKLNVKREKAAASFLENFRAKSKIEIKKEFTES